MSELRHVADSGLLPLENRKRSITIVGAGATGSFTTLALAKMGFENLSVWDADVVEMHNVDNQLYGPAHVGEYKVVALKDIIQRLADVNINQIGEFYTGEERVTGDEIVIIAVDSITTRKEIWDNLKLQLFSHYIDSRMSAEVFNIYTVDVRDYLAQRRYEKTLFPPEEAIAERCTHKSIMYTPFILGGFLANQVKRIANGEEVQEAITFGTALYQLILV